MCQEYENLHFSHIFFQHGYLNYYSTYLLENLYVHCLDVSGERMSQILDIEALVFVLLYVKQNARKNCPFLFIN